MYLVFVPDKQRKLYFCMSFELVKLVCEFKVLPDVNVSNDKTMSASLDLCRHLRTKAAISIILHTIQHNNDMMQNACADRTKSAKQKLLVIIDR